MHGCPSPFLTKSGVVVGVRSRPCPPLIAFAELLGGRGGACDPPRWHWGPWGYYMWARARQIGGRATFCPSPYPLAHKHGTARQRHGQTVDEATTRALQRGHPCPSPTPSTYPLGALSLRRLWAGVVWSAIMPGGWSVCPLLSIRSRAREWKKIIGFEVLNKTNDRDVLHRLSPTQIFSIRCIYRIMRGRYC